jgi:hypothetical protein
MSTITAMTKAQLKAAAKAAREYRARHPQRARQVSKEWKARNPDWWKGRKYVQLLTSALVNGNAKSKVFSMAGMTLDGWIELAPCLQNGGLGALVDGHKLEPIRPWRECQGTYSIFLAPENFKLVSK